MALVLADRVQETSTTTGTGTVTLLGASVGYQSFAAIGNGNTTYYTIINQGTSEWEVGIGTYTLSGTTLSRDTVLSSSAGGTTKVNFTAGTKAVFVTYPAGRSVYVDGSTVTPTNSGILPTSAGGTGSSSTAYASLTTNVSGILPGANGGTGNGFTKFSGPTTSLKTFTLPDATATILTTNAAVTPAQGGTGSTAVPTDGQILIGNTSTSVYTAATISAGTGISVTNAGGSITIASTVTSPIPAGAVMLFYQAAAPTGWTQVTTQNDKALRVVSGTGAGTGGSVGFTTAFASKTPAGTVSTSVSVNAGASIANTTAGGSISGSTGGFTLGTNEIPSHTHTNTIGNGYYNSDLGSPTIATCTYNSRPNSGGPWAGNGTGGGASHSHSLSASFTGTAHNHTITDATYTGSSSFTGTAINLAVNYIDVIICSKN